MSRLILWSGGFDSTAILISNLLNGITVDTLYINLRGNGIKSKAEKITRKKLLGLIKNHYGLTIRKDYYINCSVPELANDDKKTLRLHQPMAWLYSLSYFLDGKHDYDFIELGYISQDCFWHVRHNFERAYYHISKLLANDCTLPKLFYSLEWLDKINVYKSIYQKYKVPLEIIDAVWTCEQPKEYKKYILSCGGENSKCHPCNRHSSFRKEAELKFLGKWRLRK